MIKPRISETSWGEKRLILVGGMTDDNKAAIAAGGFDDVFLDEGEWTDLGYLVEIKEKIRSLSLRAYGACAVSSISQLDHLEQLRLDIANIPRGETLDFSRLSRLKTANILWHKSYSLNLFDTGLESLTLYQFKDQDRDCIARLSQLQELRLYRGTVTSLDWLDALERLHTLDLAHCPRLQDISHLKNKASLTWLRIEKCKHALNQEACDTILATLANLQTLFLDYTTELESLSFMGRLTRLRDTYLMGNVRNPDFETILDLPSLEKAQFISFRIPDISAEYFVEGARKRGRTAECKVMGLGRKEKTILLNVLQPGI